MALHKKDLKKRKYNYPYRPFFWSLHLKTTDTTIDEGSVGNKKGLSKEDS